MRGRKIDTNRNILVSIGLILLGIMVGITAYIISLPVLADILWLAAGFLLFWGILDGTSKRRRMRRESNK